MNLAVKFYQDTANPKGIPGQWPYECIQIGDATSYDDGSGYVWTIMSISQYDAYFEAHKGAYKTWADANPLPAVP